MPPFGGDGAYLQCGCLIIPYKIRNFAIIITLMIYGFNIQI